MVNPTDSLSAYLAAGARDSRDVLTAMVKIGLTPKQVRTAREHLGLVVTRRGSGTNARSTWALARGAGALPATDAQPTETIALDVQTARKAKVSGARASRPATATSGLEIEQGEALRLARRVEVFSARGLTAGLAHEVGLELLLRRDRAGTREVSCIECQNYRHPATCTAAEVTAGPKDVREIWMCWYSRHESP